jgi:EamA domain-containing membrane protein RarD
MPAKWVKSMFLFCHFVVACTVLLLAGRWWPFVPVPYNPSFVIPFSLGGFLSPLFDWLLHVFKAYPDPMCSLADKMPL